MLNFKWMIEDLVLALRLQALDRKIAALETEIATLPKHIAEIEKRLEAHSRRLEADRAALAANLRDRKKMEGDIQLHEQKMSKLREQMAAAKTNEHYKAFQNEIAYIAGEVRKCEDRIIVLMEQSEPLDKNVKAAEISLKAEQQEVDAAKITARERTAIDQKLLAEQVAERKGIAVQMESKLYTEYERVRKKSKNTPIADATDGRCSACQMALRPQFFQDLRRQDKIMFCESCSRILTYNPVIDVVAEQIA
jgi:predicted  nucleic acid-binding Zn-ribbon protein